MDCDFVRDHVHFYLDREFDEPDAKGFEEHIRFCGPCRESFALERGFLKTLRHGLEEGRTEASADLHERISSVLLLGGEREGWSWGWVPLAAAAMLVVVASFALLTRGGAGAGDDPMTFRGTSLATQEFVANHFPHPVRLPLDEDGDTRLVGAQLISSARSPAVVFYYEVQGRSVSVLQRPEDLPSPVRRPSPGPSSVHAVPVSFER
jgi:hypothetical protein